MLADHQNTRCKRAGSWYNFGKCPDCKTIRLVPEKLIQTNGETRNRCGSCAQTRRRLESPIIHAKPSAKEVARRIATNFLNRKLFDSEIIAFPPNEIPTLDNILVTHSGTPVKNLPLRDYKW